MQLCILYEKTGAIKEGRISTRRKRCFAKRKYSNEIAHRKKHIERYRMVMSEIEHLGIGRELNKQTNK